MSIASYVTPVSEAVPGSAEPVVPAVSALVLVTGRPDGLAELYEELATSLRVGCDRFEVVFVLEPPFSDAPTPLGDLAARGEPIRVVRVGQRRGEAGLLRVGVPHCRGAIIVTVPSDRRIETAALGRLIGAVEAGADLAVARRWPRRDSWIIRTQTRLFHTIAGRLVGGTAAIHDVACGVWAMRRELLDRIPLYGDLALFLPLLAARDGHSVREVPAPQHAANQRQRLHSPGLYVRRLFDLLGLFFLVRFTEKPLRFFGLVGSAIALPGATILAVIFLQRLAGQGIADRPLLLLGVLCFVLGIQAIALGLIGEIIVHLHADQRRSYRLREDGPGPVGPTS